MNETPRDRNGNLIPDLANVWQPRPIPHRILAHAVLASLRAAHAVWMLAARDLADLPLPDAAREEARAIEPALDRLERAVAHIARTP